jgi:ABC-type branched-subunit amino acid transport system permease subunit
MAAFRALAEALPATKRLVFTLAALGAGLAGALWLASFPTFRPKTYFGVHSRT